MERKIALLIAMMILLAMVPVNVIAAGNAGFKEEYEYYYNENEEEQIDTDSTNDQYVLPINMISLFSNSAITNIPSGAAIELEMMRLTAVSKSSATEYFVYFGYPFGNLDYYSTSAGRNEIIEFIRQNIVVSYTIGTAAEVALADTDIVAIGTSNNGTVGGVNGLLLELKMPELETEAEAILRFFYKPTNTAKEFSTTIAGKNTAKIERVTVNGNSSLSTGSDGLSYTIKAYDSTVKLDEKKALQLNIQYTGKITEILLDDKDINYYKIPDGRIQTAAFIPSESNMVMKATVESSDGSVIKTFTIIIENHLDWEARLGKMNLATISKATPKIYRVYFDYPFGNLMHYTSSQQGKDEILNLICQNINISYKIGTASEVILTSSDIKIVGTANNGTVGGINGLELELNLPECETEVAATLNFNYSPTNTSASINTTMPGDNIVMLDIVRSYNGIYYSSWESGSLSITYKALDSSIIVNGEKALRLNMFYTADIKEILLDGKALGYESRYSGGGEIVTEPFIPTDGDMTMEVTIVSKNAAVEKTYTITIKNYLTKSVEPDYTKLSNGNKTLEVRFGSNPRVGDIIKVYSSLTEVQPIQTFTIAEGATTILQTLTLNNAATSNVYVAIASSHKEESKRVLSTGYIAPSSGGDNSNNYSGGSDNNDSGSSDSTTPSAGNPVTTTSSQTTDFNTAAQDMLTSGKDLQLILGSSTSISLSGETLNIALNENKPLVVTKDNVSAVVPSSVLEGLNLKSNDNVTLSFNKTSVKLAENDNTKSDSLNKVLSDQAFEVNFHVNGNNVTTFEQPLSLRFNVSEYKMSNEQKNKLTGVRHLSEGQYNQLGGSWISTNVFEFQTSKLSVYGMLITDNIVKLVTSIDNKVYTVNGREFVSDIAPTIIDNRTMVPVRFIAEALGADVKWDDNTKNVTISLGSQTLNFRIGEKAPGMDVPAIIANNRTLVPLRYVSEQLGANVIWNSGAKSIGIFR